MALGPLARCLASINFCRWNTYQAVQRTITGYLVLHIGRTPLWNFWLRMLGMRVGMNTVIDSVSINEPDLISIGHNVKVAEDAFISAATVVPAGFVDENGKSCAMLRVTSFSMALTTGAGGGVRWGAHSRHASIANSSVAIWHVNRHVHVCLS